MREIGEKKTVSEESKVSKYIVDFQQLTVKHRRKK